MRSILVAAFALVLSSVSLGGVGEQAFSAATLEPVAASEVRPGHLYFIDSLAGKRNLVFALEPLARMEGESALERWLEREVVSDRSEFRRKRERFGKFPNARLSWWAVRGGSRLMGWRLGLDDAAKQNVLYGFKEEIAADGVMELTAVPLVGRVGLESEVLVTGGMGFPSLSWQWDTQVGEWKVRPKSAFDPEKVWLPVTGDLVAGRQYQWFNAESEAFVARVFVGRRTDGTLQWRNTALGEVARSEDFGGDLSPSARSKFYRFVRGENGVAVWVPSEAPVLRARPQTFLDESVPGPFHQEKTFFPEETVFGAYFDLPVPQLKQMLKQLAPY